MVAEEGEVAEDLIEILEASSMPIDLARYVNHVCDPVVGAIATFEGTTHDTFGEKCILELRYEAYVPIALWHLRAICSDARIARPHHRLAVAQHLSTVLIDEASIFVAASVVDRVDTLEACYILIDEVKVSVPIWKKV
ncbi:molybdopterin synthase catalytic subunit-like [Elaeis guineensis]